MHLKKLTWKDKATEILLEKIRESIKARCERNGKEKEVFERIVYIFPTNIVVRNYPRKPLAVFNPGAVLKGNIIEVFPRMVFDYYWYSSSIGKFSLKIEDLIQGTVPKEIETDIIIYPTEPWDLRGCEDPRLYTLPSGEDLVLYTGVSLSQEGVMARQALGLLNEGNFRKLGYLTLKLEDERYETFWKDSAVVDWGYRDASLLTRPLVPMENSGLEVGWFGFVDKSDLSMDVKEMKPILFPMSYEQKVGWSTNALKLSSNEYLVGWHGVGQDMIYRNGLALVSSDGELLGITEYILSPRRDLIEFYGDRPGVVFGDGLIKYAEKLIWIGGISDFAVGVFAVDYEIALEHMKNCK